MFVTSPVSSRSSRAAAAIAVSSLSMLPPGKATTSTVSTAPLIRGAKSAQTFDRETGSRCWQLGLYRLPLSGRRMEQHYSPAAGYSTGSGTLVLWLCAVGAAGRENRI